MRLNKEKLLVIVSGLLIFIFGNISYAADGGDTKSTIKELREALKKSPTDGKASKALVVALEKEEAKKSNQKKLSAYNPNHIIWAVPQGSNTGGEQAHAEIYISLKYPLIGGFNEVSRADLLDGKVEPDPKYQVNFIYNSMYDFYMGGEGQYDSSPVVSREQNPGVAAEFNFDRYGKETSLWAVNSRVEIGAFHRSNGQTTEKSDSDDPAEALDNSLGENGEITDYTLSGVSRGSNYGMLKFTTGLGHWREGPLTKEDWTLFSAEYRYFGGGSSDDIWWEPGNDMQLQDVDGLRLRWARSFGSKWNVDIGARTGVSDWDALGNLTYSVDLRWKVKKTNTWLNLRAFNGYSENFSTYHQRRDYLGIGISMF